MFTKDMTFNQIKKEIIRYCKEHGVCDDECEIGKSIGVFNCEIYSDDQGLIFWSDDKIMHVYNDMLIRQNEKDFKSR